MGETSWVIREVDDVERWRGGWGDIGEAEHGG
jgi:hypothetical protein